MCSLFGMHRLCLSCNAYLYLYNSNFIGGKKRIVAVNSRYSALRQPLRKADCLINKNEICNLSATHEAYKSGEKKR